MSDEEIDYHSYPDQVKELKLFTETEAYEGNRVSIYDKEIDYLSYSDREKELEIISIFLLIIIIIKYAKGGGN